jgi:succinyl-diaminopimelate desuccinylase|tara:strand:+ start:457 stop:1623 length:1167 start_codon:yes stop_codon:yes gene_type:complete
VYQSHIKENLVSEISETLALAQALIRKPSVTPDDKGCQRLLSDALEPYGFVPEFMQFGDVQNLWIKRGTNAPLFVFAGHTDVVPTGPEENWSYSPFSGDIVDGMLHGRGAADMKGSLAAMVTACQRFVQARPNHPGSIALLLTSDEEGPAVDGTVRVIDTLKARNEVIDYCLVGEPTSAERLGDIVKNGRRGSLGGTLTVRGIQGHVAYPHLADNPIHRLSSIVSDLCATHWDDGNEYFPATTFQVSNIEAGTGATNVVPGDARAQFNLRFCPDSSASSLKEKIESACSRHAEFFEIDWCPLGLPYQTLPGTLLSAVEDSVKEITGHSPGLSTDGGTSDGRFIAPTGAQVVELGPLNRTIHQVDEVVDADDLDALSNVYEKVLDRILK